MKQSLISILDAICPNNVFLQGTLNPDDEYPESFITFWTDSTDEGSFYDDAGNRVDWHYSVIYYSSDPSLVASVPATIIQSLKAAGFQAQGRGNDIPSDVMSHSGWAMDFIYSERI